MKAGVEAWIGFRESMLRRELSWWWAATLLVLLVTILGELWMYLFGDSASLLLPAIAGVGFLKPSSLEARLQPAPGNAESEQHIPEQIVLAHLRSVLHLGLTLLNARCVVLALLDTCTGQHLEWSLHRAEALPASETERCKLGVRSGMSELGSAIYIRDQAEFSCLGVSQEGRRIGGARLRSQLSALWRGSFQTLLLSHLEVGSRWHGTVVYLDAPVEGCSERELEKLRQVANLAASGWDIFHTASDAARKCERQRLARDLHDGVTQSLIAAELQLATLQHQKLLDVESGIETLRKAREALRNETRNLRDQIEELQRGESATSLKDVAGRLVKRFERETGIVTRLVVEQIDAQFPPQVAFELLYLLREALSNVRKHSGASRVDVRLFVRDGVHLCVQDNGCGFSFSGVYELKELQTMLQKPRTICDRVQGNGGTLKIESSPASGVRMEIVLPLDPGKPFAVAQPVAMLQMSRVKSRQTPLRKPPYSVASAGYLSKTS